MRESPLVSETEPVSVVVVTAAGCHYCDHAQQVLDTIGETVPLAVTTVDLSSDEGLALMVAHRAGFPPLVVVDGEFFGFGRISLKKLERRLTQRVASVGEG
jgi:glutaredoxin